MKAKMADEKVEEAKEQEEALITEEERQFEEEKEEEKQEDADFEAVKKRLSEDEAEAELTRKFFDNEMLAINERLHHLSGRVEEISERLPGPFFCRDRELSAGVELLSSRSVAPP